MKNIKKLCIFLLIVLCGWFPIFAQQQASFYFYRGETISLPVNNQHFFVYIDTIETSLEKLEKEFRITEVLNTLEESVLGVQLYIPNDNYDSVVRTLESKEYVVDVEAVVGDSVFYNIDRLFYVKLKQPADYTLLQTTASSTGAEIVCEVPHCPNWYRLKVNKYSAGNSIKVANMFWETGLFENIDPGFIFHFEPNVEVFCVMDARFNEQWGMEAIKACSAWKITTGDTTVRVAVIDMGIDINHWEFDAAHVVYSYDVETDSFPAHVYCDEQERSDQQPNNNLVCVFHGLHVGGIIFANHNRDSVAGVAPNVGMINISHTLKVNNSQDAEELVAAINLAVENGARVINNSWGDRGGECTFLHNSMIEEAIDNAIDSGCVVVFSAGNSSNDSVNYPASYRPEILVVSSITQNYFLEDCANYYKGLDIVAPGADILSTHLYISTQNEYGYLKQGGTSMAAPHVSGVAGLML